MRHYVGFTPSSKNFWEAGHVPQTVRDPMIQMIYKRKGSTADPSNYGISLLDVAGKVLARILLTRLLSSIADTVLPERPKYYRHDLCGQATA